MRARRVDQGFGRDLDAQVDHPIAVVGQDDLDKILADVVHVTLDRGQDDGALVHPVHLLHERFQVLDRGLHGLGALQHLGHDEFVVVEQPTDFVHAGHERAVDDIQCGPLGQRRVQVVGQAVLGALDDEAGQPFVQRQVGARVHDDRRLLLAEMRGKGGDRVLAAPEDQVLGQPFLVRGDRGVARQLLGVDDRQVEPGLNAQVEEDRVEDLAAGRRQAERDVADAENGLAGRQGALDRRHAGYRLLAGADVVPVAGAEREHQRVEDQVLGRQPVLLGQQCETPLRDGELPLPADGHALLWVFVDAADHHGRAVAPEQRHDPGEALLAVFQVDRVDDGLALRAFQRGADHVGVGRVDHQRDFDLADHLVQKRGHVGQLVAVRVGQTHVHDVGAAAHLPAADFRGVLERAFGDQPLEPPRADHVRALADQHRALVVVDHERFQPRHRAARGPWRTPRRLAVQHPAEPADVRRRGAATAAQHVQPALVDEALQLGGERLGRLVVASVLVGQAGVGNAQRRKPRDLGESAQMVGHEIGTGRTVEPHRQQVAVRNRDVQRLHPLASQHRAHRFDGHRHGHGHAHADRLDRVVDAEQRGLEVERVLRGLQEKQVHAAVQQPFDLFGVCLPQLGEGDAAGDRQGFGCGPQRAGHEARLVRGGVRPCRGARQFRGRLVDVARPVVQAELGQHDAGGTEGVRLDDVGAGVQKAGVNLRDDLRAGQDQVFVAAVVLGTTEVFSAKVFGLDGRPHRAVEQQHAFGQQRNQVGRRGNERGVFRHGRRILRTDGE